MMSCKPVSFETLQNRRIQRKFENTTWKIGKWNCICYCRYISTAVGFQGFQGFKI